MVSKFNCLPPLKRYRLIQQLNQETKNPKNITTATPLCLPAKKRKQCLDSPPPPPLPPPISTSICLPAKKRIFAFHPFDLNLQYNDESEKSAAAQDPVTATAAADEEEDGILCAVCESTDGDPTDPIVLCDGCDLMVHATCYGHPFTAGIPDGDWFCAQCLETKSDTPKKPAACCLCPVAGGALKLTTDGRWAHLVCAIYVPEVFFADAIGREGIDCSKVLERRWNRKCYICETKNGCAVDCSESKCALSFHVSCGLKEDLCVEYRDNGRNNNNKVAVVAAFCAVHTNLWKKQEQTGKFKIVARDEDNN